MNKIFLMIDIPCPLCLADDVEILEVDQATEGNNKPIITAECQSCHSKIRMKTEYNVINISATQGKRKIIIDKKRNIINEYDLT